jgi:hypothetical protein
MQGEEVRRRRGRRLLDRATSSSSPLSSRASSLLPSSLPSELHPPSMSKCFTACVWYTRDCATCKIFVCRSLLLQPGKRVHSLRSALLFLPETMIATACPSVISPAEALLTNDRACETWLSIMGSRSSRGVIRSWPRASLIHVPDSRMNPAMVGRRPWQGIGTF